MRYATQPVLERGDNVENENQISSHKTVASACQ